MLPPDTARQQSSAHCLTAPPLDADRGKVPVPNTTLLEQEESPSHPDTGDSSPAEKNTPTLALKPLASAAVGFKMQCGSMQDSGSSLELSNSRGKGGLQRQDSLPFQLAATCAAPWPSPGPGRERSAARPGRGSVRAAAGCRGAAGPVPIPSSLLRR